MNADRSWLDKLPAYLPRFWTTRQGKVGPLFGDRLSTILAELNETLAA